LQVALEPSAHLSAGKERVKTETGKSGLMAAAVLTEGHYTYDRIASGDWPVGG